MVLEAKFGDAFHLGTGGREFRGGVVVDAGLEGLQDLRLGVVADGDDEGEAVLGDVLFVQPLEGAAFVVGQRVKRGAGLFGGGFRRQAFRCGEFPGQIGVGFENLEAFIGAGASEYAGQGVVQARR